MELFGSNLRFRVLLQLVLLCYILSFGISQFITDKFIKVQLLRSGNVHLNPDPVDDSSRFCHWNLNGVCASDKIKISLIEAYNSVFLYGIIEILRNENEDKTKMQMTQSFNQYSENETKIWHQNILNQFNRVSSPCLRSHFVISLIAVNETYVNESIKDEDIRIEGYSREILRSNHPNGKKEGGVCLYFFKPLH